MGNFLRGTNNAKFCGDLLLIATGAWLVKALFKKKNN